jgi:hypothetical protein
LTKSALPEAKSAFLIDFVAMTPALGLNYSKQKPVRTNIVFRSEYSGSFMKFQKAGILSLGFSILLFSFLTASLTTLNTGCATKSPTSAGVPTPTPAPIAVVFVIDNLNSSNDGYVTLTRVSNGDKYFSDVSIPQGTTAGVTVNIPASDAYNILISQNGTTYGSYGTWNSFSLTLGDFYPVSISSGNTGTINGAICSPCDFK